MHTLDGGRIGIAAQALGIAEGALRQSNCIRKREKAVRPYDRSVQQNTQFQLADMATRVEAAQLLVYRAAMAKATQKVIFRRGRKGKTVSQQRLLWKLPQRLSSCHGGYGYIREYDVERMMRDAKITEIYEGTSEVQRMVISGALLK